MNHSRGFETLESPLAVTSNNIKELGRARFESEPTFGNRFLDKRVCVGVEVDFSILWILQTLLPR